MRRLASVISIMGILTAPAIAQQETLIRNANGGYTIVRSDESGTTTIEEKEGAKATAISPQEKERWDKVFEFTGRGGQVIAHQSKSAR